MILKIFRLKFMEFVALMRLSTELFDTDPIENFQKRLCTLFFAVDRLS